jgi:hypothetical protein
MFNKENHEMVVGSTDKRTYKSETKRFQWVILLLCLVIVFEAVIIVRLTDINHVIKQINSNLALTHQTRNEDFRDFRSFDHELFKFVPSKVRKFSGADYFRNKNTLDPSILMSAEEYKLQLSKEMQTNKNRSKK